MHTAESETMFLSVSVTKDSLETHFQVVTDQLPHHQDQRLLIHADQVLVASMQNAEKEMELLHVHAYLVSEEILMWSVSQSVPSTQNVPSTKHV